MDVEQFPSLLLWRDGTGSCEVSGVGAGNQALSGTEFCRSREPTHSQSARMSGAPGHALIRISLAPPVNATGRPEIQAAGVSAVLGSTRGWFASEAASLTYDRKNSFASGSQSWLWVWGERSFTATPPSWASAPANAIGIRRCRRLADSSVHQRASAPPNRFLKLV